MTWVPLVMLIFEMIIAVLKALSDPQSVKMWIKTADGVTTMYPCKVVRVPRKGLDRAKITANINVKSPIIGAVIQVDGRNIARAHFHKDGQLVLSGPTTLEHTM